MNDVDVDSDAATVAAPSEDESESLQIYIEEEIAAKDMSIGKYMSFSPTPLDTLLASASGVAAGVTSKTYAQALAQSPPAPVCRFVSLVSLPCLHM
jgi:hypothetical protein